MLGPFTFTFTLESEEFEKSEKLGCMYVIDHLLAPDGANKYFTKGGRGHHFMK